MKQYEIELTNASAQKWHNWAKWNVIQLFSLSMRVGRQRFQRSQVSKLLRERFGSFVCGGQTYNWHIEGRKITATTRWHIRRTPDKYVTLHFTISAKTLTAIRKWARGEGK